MIIDGWDDEMLQSITVQGEPSRLNALKATDGSKYSCHAVTTRTCTTVSHGQSHDGMVWGVMADNTRRYSLNDEVPASSTEFLGRTAGVGHGPPRRESMYGCMQCGLDDSSGRATCKTSSPAAAIRPAILLLDHSALQQLQCNNEVVDQHIPHSTCHTILTT